MRLLNLILSLVILSTMTLTSLAQVIELNPVISRDEGKFHLSVDGTQSDIQELAQQVFSLHGAFQLVKPDQAAVKVGLQAIAVDTVLLRIEANGQVQEREIRGSRLDAAVLRACDLVVNWATGLNGFFSGKLAFVAKRNGVSEIYSSDLLFQEVRALTSDRSLVTGPCWSPGGTQLLFTTYYKSGFPDIYKLDLLAGLKKPVASYKGTNTGGSFSPDGRRIAMVLSGTGNSEIWVADSNGKNRKRLTRNDSLEASPSWSPDGSRLVFTSDSAGRPQIYEMNIESGPMRRLPTAVSRYCTEPAWNPVKEEEIAFTAAVKGGFQIFLYNRSSRSSRQLTSVVNSAVEPCWLNDGRHLIFTKRTGGNTRLMLLDTVSGKLSALHKTSVGDTSSATFAY